VRRHDGCREPGRLDSNRVPRQVLVLPRARRLLSPPVRGPTRRGRASRGRAAALSGCSRGACARRHEPARDRTRRAGAADGGVRLGPAPTPGRQRPTRQSRVRRGRASDRGKRSRHRWPDRADSRLGTRSEDSSRALPFPTLAGRRGRVRHRPLQQASDRSRERRAVSQARPAKHCRDGRARRDAHPPGSCPRSYALCRRHSRAPASRSRKAPRTTRR
jgi:hypothetical protein